MTRDEYNTRIQKIDNLPGWISLAGDLRKQGVEFRSVDAKLTLIMQGLAVQIDRYVSHITEKQEQISREVEVKLSAEPIDSEPDITIK